MALAAEQKDVDTVMSGFAAFDPRRPKTNEPSGTTTRIATTMRMNSATTGEAALLSNLSLPLVYDGQIWRFEPQSEAGASGAHEFGNWPVEVLRRAAIPIDSCLAVPSSREGGAPQGRSGATRLRGRLGLTRLHLS